MEIDQAQLEKIMTRQVERVARESDKRFDKKLAKWGKESDERFANWSKKSDEKMDKTIAKWTAESDKRFAKWSKESDERMQNYIGMLKEDFDHKLDAVLEYVKDIPDIKRRQDIMFEKIGDILVRITVLEQVVKAHSIKLRG